MCGADGSEALSKPVNEPGFRVDYVPIQEKTVEHYRAVIDAAMLYLSQHDGDNAWKTLYRSEQMATPKVNWRE